MPHSASNMHNGYWMIVRLLEPRRPTGGTPCVALGFVDGLYAAWDALKLVEWLDEREAGYPPRDLPWPAWLAPTPYSDQEGATWRPRTPWGSIDILTGETLYDP